MAQSRRLRLGRRSEPGRSYLVTISADHRRLVFDRLETVRCVAWSIASVRSEAHTWCWVAMPDHLHWLFELLPDGRLSATVQKFKSLTTRCVRHQSDLGGPVWQRGFHDRAIRKEENLRAAARYVIANPLRAGLVERIGDYPFWDAVWLD